MRTTVAALLVVGLWVSGVSPAAGLTRVASTTAQSTSSSTINVLELGVVGDGVVDDTAAIQAVLDDAPAGATVYFPDVAPGWYSVSDHLRIEKPLAIVGDGPNSGSEFRQTEPNKRTIDIRSSDVTVEGIRIIGYEYGEKNEENGIAVNYAQEGRKSNITIRNNWIQNVSGRGISFILVDDFVISENHVEDAHYAGIFGWGSSRGSIDNNQVIDIGSPVSGTPFENSYPVIVTAEPDSPQSSDVIIRNNVARQSPVWTGIMNHGGVRILILDNEVYDADFLYANTWDRERPSHYTSFINNYGENGPRNALWLIGPDDELTVGVRAIGNQFRNASNILTWNSGDGVITWNEMVEGDGEALRLEKTTRNTVVANNYFDESTISYEDDYEPPPPSATPPAPQALEVNRSGDTATLTWDYDPAETHDSFYIEHKTADGEWQRLAYRPPNDPMWSFDAPTNPHWAAFDPLTFTATGLDPNESYEFRIRANNREAFSEWFATTVEFDSALYDDIEWLVAADTTSECNPPLNGSPCPEAVTQGAVAAFLHHALGVLRSLNGGG